MAATEDPDAEHPDLIELIAGTDLGSLEVVVARLTSDGIPARIEPDETGLIMDENTGGYRLLLRRDDLEAARPVLDIAEIEIPESF